LADQLTHKFIQEGHR